MTDGSELPALPMREQYGPTLKGSDRQNARVSLAAWYRSGRSVDQLSALTGWSTATVARLLKEGGCPMRSPGGARPGGPRPHYIQSLTGKRKHRRNT